jgi:hypothetical protein
VTTEDYLRRVWFALYDLPWRTKRELVSELRAHLAELPEGTDLRERLGPPEQYAADMRVAAGLERRRGLVAYLRARRPRNLILIALALTVTGLAIGAVVWIDSYQPIQFAGAAQFPLGAKPSIGQAGETVEFHNGRPFVFGITIHNTGRFTVRVLGIARSPMDFFAGRLLMSKDQSPRIDERPLERFSPFNMKPGSFRWLVFKGVEACTTGMTMDPAGAAGVTRDLVPVRFSFLWRTATAWIPLETPLSFSFPKGCPRPARYR